MELSEKDKKTLREAFSVKSHLAGNLLTFIGLDDVRANFPGEWVRNRDRILGTTRAILAQFTDPATDIVL